MSRKKNPEEYVAELAEKNPTIVAIGRYDGAHVKIEHRCLVCGRRWMVTPDNILKGSGCPPCAFKRWTANRRRPNEIIEDCGNYLEIDISTKTYPDTRMLVDKEDWHRYLAEDGRRVSAAKPGSRVYGFVMSSDNTHLRFHRLVVDAPFGFEVDHISWTSNQLIDNRRRNLRICTRAENARNIGLRSHNASGVTGVSWHAKSGKWLARITVNHKKIRLGYFHSFAEAVASRKAAEKEFFGEFAFGAKNPG